MFCKSFFLLIGKKQTTHWASIDSFCTSDEQMQETYKRFRGSFKEHSYHIWFQLAKWFQRRLKTDDTLFDTISLFLLIEGTKRNKKPDGVKKGVVCFDSSSLKPLGQLVPNLV
jgi:hypothetical protein